MSEQKLGKEIAKLLDFSADENIKQSTLYRLQSARRAALENYESATLKIMNTGNGTSVYSEHDGYMNTGKLLLLLTVLVTFALVSATYWQFLEKGRYAAIDDTTILTHDFPADAHIDNVLELVDDLLIDTRDDEPGLTDDLLADTRDDEPELTDAFPADARIDNESELTDDLPADTRTDDGFELTDGFPADTHNDNALELVDDLPTDTHADNEFEKWLDSN